MLIEKFRHFFMMMMMKILVLLFHVNLANTAGMNIKGGSLKINSLSSQSGHQVKHFRQKGLQM